MVCYKNYRVQYGLLNLDPLGDLVEWSNTLDSKSNFFGSVGSNPAVIDLATIEFLACILN